MHLVAWVAFFALAYFASIGDLIQAPGVFLGTSGDAIKNNFTFLYQLRFGMSATHFHGLNFPFGDHVVMTDGQPMLVWLLRLLGLGGTDGPSVEFLLGVHNGLLLLEMPIAAGLLYRVFRALRLSVSEAWVAGASLALMSPQVLRWGGHYALGHVAVLPLALWLQIKRWTGPAPGRGWGIAIAANSLFWGFIHPYYLPILALLSLVLESGLQARCGLAWKRKRRIVPILVQVLLPLSAFLAFMKLTDPIIDRGSAEAVFNTTFAGVFLTRWRDLLGAIDPGLRSQFAIPNFEGIIPLGLCALPLLWVVLFGAVTLLKRRKRLGSRLSLLIHLLFAAVLALIFSFGFHLEGSWAPFFAQVPPIRQFRSVARFAWVFALGFSVVSVACSVRVLRWAGITGRIPRRSSRALIWVLLFFQAGESILWFQWNLRELRTRITRLERTALPGLDRIDVRQYQAVLPLPYFHVGSGGSDDLAADDPTLRQSLLLSLATGIPNLGSHLSRSSLSQARLLVGAIHRGENRQHWIDTLSPSADLLVWIGRRELLTPAEESLARLSEPIDAVEGQGLFRLRVSHLKK